MAEVGAAPRNSNISQACMVAVTVKSTKDRKDIVIEDDKTISQFKVLVAKELNIAKEQLCLVFHGNTLKNTSTLKQCSITDGAIVRAIVKIFPTGSSLNIKKVSKADTKATPFGLNSLGGLNGLMDMGFGSANFAEVQQKVQKEIYSNPKLMGALLDNPIVQEIMSQPDLYRQMVASNPFMAEIMQTNPEVNEMLENPGLMKQMMSLARQPTLLQELMDPKYRNFVGLKEGEEEPSHVQSSKPSPCGDAGSCDKAADRNEPGFLDKSTESLLRQMIEQPKNMANLIQAPYVQSAINFAATNQEYLRQMMNYIPGVKDNEEVKKQLDLSLPYFAQQLANPEVQNLMCNPRALQAMLDIQEGLKELQSEVPGFFGLEPIPPTKEDNSSLLSQVFSSVTSHVSEQPDEEKYVLQLRHLYLMGFTNQEENLRVLSQVGGDINSVIIHHLQQQHQQNMDEYQPAEDEGVELHQEQQQLEDELQDQEADQEELLEQPEQSFAEPEGKNMEDQLLLDDQTEGQDQQQEPIDEQADEGEVDYGVVDESDKEQQALLLQEEELEDREVESSYEPQSEDVQMEQ